MQRNNAIDSVKGFAILLVMVGHCIVLNGLDRTDPYIYDIIKSIQMPLFMLVSGVLASCGVRKNGKGDGFKKLRHRTEAYLVPFFSWFVIVYLFTHFKTGNLSIRGFGEELKGLLFQTDRGLWFLMTLFVITVCVMTAQAIADRLVKDSSEIRKSMVFMLISACLYILFFWQSRSGNTFLSPSLMLQYYPFYLIGYFVNGYIKTTVPRMVEKTVVPVMLILFIGIVAVFDLNVPVDGIQTLAIQMLASFLGTVSCYVIVYRVCEKNKKTENVGFLSFIGLYTLEIYVIHFRFARILHLADKDLQLYSLQGIGWVVLAFMVMSALTAVSIFILRRIPIVSFLLFGKPHVKISDRASRQA